MPTTHRLAELRRAAGISQADLARELGVSGAAICRWEAGERAMDDDTKLRLARRFDVPVAYLMGWDDAPLEPAA